MIIFFLSFLRYIKYLIILVEYIIGVICIFCKYIMIKYSMKEKRKKILRDNWYLILDLNFLGFVNNILILSVW